MGSRVEAHWVLRGVFGVHVTWALVKNLNSFAVLVFEEGVLEAGPPLVWIVLGRDCAEACRFLLVSVDLRARGKGFQF